MTTTRRRILPRLLLILLITPLALVIAAVGFLASPWGEEVIRDQAIIRGEAATGLRLEIDGFETSVFSRLTLTGVRAWHPEVADSVDLLAFDRLHVEFSLLPLLRKRIVVDTLAVDGLSAHLVTRPDGRMNLPEFPPADTSAVPDTSNPSPFPYDVVVGGAAVRVRNASYFDQGQDLAARLDSLSIHLHGDPVRYDYRLGWERVRVESGGRRLGVDEFLLGGRVLGDTLKVDTLNLAAPGASLDGSGDAEIAAGDDSLQSVDAGIDLAADLDGLTRPVEDLIPPMLRPLSGRLALGLRVTGTTDRPEAALRVESEQVRAGRFGVDDLTLRVRAGREAIHLDTLSLTTFNGSLAGKGSLTLTEPREHDVELRLNDIDLDAIQRALADSTALAAADTAAVTPFVLGRVRGIVSSRGPLTDLANLHARAQLIADIAVPGDSTMAAYQVTARVADRRATAGFKRGATTLRVTTTLDTSALDGQFTLFVPDIDQLTRPLGIPGVSGRLLGEGRFVGSLSAPRVVADLNGSAIAYQGLPVDTLTASVLADTAGVIVDRVWLHGALDKIDPDRPPLNLAGLEGRNIHYELEAAGTLPDVRGQIDLEAGRFRFNEIAADSIDTKVLLRGDRINLAWLRVDRDHRRLNGSGYFGIDERSGGFDLWFTDQSRNDRDEDEDDDDEDDRGRDDILDLAAASGVSSSSIQSDGRLRTTFNLPDSGSALIEFRGEGGGIPLGLIPRVHPSLASVRGMLGMTVEFVGTPQAPSARFRVTLDSLHTPYISLDSLQLAGRFNDQDLDATLRGRIPGSEPLRVRVTLPLESTPTGVQPARDRDINASLATRGIDLAAFSDLLPQDLKMRGRLAMQYQVSGTLAMPQLSGKIDLADGHMLLGPDQPVLDSLALSLRQQDSTVFIDRLQTFTLDNLFALSGRGQLLPGGAIDGALDLHLNGAEALRASGGFAEGQYNAEITIPGLSIEPFETLVPALIDMKGTLTGSATVTGDTTGTLPVIHGELRGDGLNLDFADMAEYVDHGHFAARFSSTGVVLDTLSAEFGRSGRVYAKGGVDVYQGNIFYDLRAWGNDLRVANDQMTVTVDRMNIGFQSHDTDYHVLSGDVYLGETLYEQDWRLDTILRQVNAAPTSRRIGQTESMAQDIYLNVRLREADRIEIDNNLAELKVSANLQTAGTASDPILTGRVSLDEGYVNYLDQRFVIDRGVIDFVETGSIDPYLNLSATSEVVDFNEGERIVYNVTMNVTGNVSQARVDFTSDPYLDQSSILALLTFGSPAAGGQIAGQAGSLAGRALSSYVGARVGSAVGLDQVSVQGNLFSGGDGQGATLSATKEISNRAEVTYITNVRTFQDNALRVSYYLSDYWTLTGETNQEGEGSLDIKYRIRWKEIRFK